MTKTEATRQTKRELPDGWRWVRLGEIVHVRSGDFLPATRMDTHGEFPVYGGNGVAGFHSSYMFEEPKVLVGRVGALCGCVHLTKTKSWITDNALYVDVKKCPLDDEFLFFWLTKMDLRGLANQMGQPVISGASLYAATCPLPPFHEQERIAVVLKQQMSAVDKAHAAAQARLEAAMALPAALGRQTLRDGQKQRRFLGDCLVEVRNGVGADWGKYPVLGATRAGLAPAKEAVGKTPERYKLADPGTVFYNPMRILLGSIAMVDEGDATGITSPDYVVVKGRPGILDTRWFYYWFRSAQGAHLIDSLSRGAVRERILFNRLAAGKIELPDYETQLHASARMKQVKPIVESVTKELKNINALPAALLRRAFNGEI